MVLLRCTEIIHIIHCDCSEIFLVFACCIFSLNLLRIKVNLFWVVWAGVLLAFWYASCFCICLKVCFVSQVFSLLLILWSWASSNLKTVPCCTWSLVNIASINFLIPEDTGWVTLDVLLLIQTLVLLTCNCLLFSLLRKLAPLVPIPFISFCAFPASSTLRVGLRLTCYLLLARTAISFHLLPQLAIAMLV